MSYPVTYRCPHCGTGVEIERSGYLADKSVTPYPLVGWEYVVPDEDVEAADGVVFTCEADDTPTDDGVEGRTEDGADGCGERFYLSFVRFEDGEEVEPEPESEYVELGVGPGRGPNAGPNWGPDAGP